MLKSNELIPMHQVILNQMKKDLINTSSPDLVKKFLAEKNIEISVSFLISSVLPLDQLEEIEKQINEMVTLLESEYNDYISIFTWMILKRLHKNICFRQSQ